MLDYSKLEKFCQDNNLLWSFGNSRLTGKGVFDLRIVPKDYYHSLTKKSWVVIEVGTSVAQINNAIEKAKIFLQKEGKKVVC
jgi:hypothetical protein